MKIALMVIITLALSVWLSTERPLTFTLEPHDDTVTEASWYVLRSQANQPCSYQWFKDGQVLPGATNATFVLDYFLEGDVGTYHVVANNGHTTVTSRSVVITYNPAIRVVVDGDMVTLDADVPIHFTLDGSEPNQFSPMYLTPLLITKPCILRAMAGNVEMEYVRFVLDKRQDDPTDAE